MNTVPERLQSDEPSDRYQGEQSIVGLKASMEWLKSDIEKRQGIIDSHYSLLRTAKSELERINGQLAEMKAKMKGKGKEV